MLENIKYFGLNDYRDARVFIGTTGYFSQYKNDFKSLDKCTFGTLMSVIDNTGSYHYVCGENNVAYIYFYPDVEISNTDTWSKWAEDTFKQFFGEDFSKLKNNKETNMLIEENAVLDSTSYLKLSDADKKKYKNTQVYGFNSLTEFENVNRQADLDEFKCLLVGYNDLSENFLVLTHDGYHQLRNFIVPVDKVNINKLVYYPLDSEAFLSIVKNNNFLTIRNRYTHETTITNCFAVRLKRDVKFSIYPLGAFSPEELLNNFEYKDPKTGRFERFGVCF